MSAKESCVMSVTVVGANDDGTAVGSGAVAVAEPDPADEAHALRSAAATTSVATRPPRRELDC
jgi:hypothetical protein